MSSFFIGYLLDEALAFATTSPPRPLTVKAPLMGLSGDEERQIEPRSVARALLANRLRDLLASLPGKEVTGEDGGPPSYDEAFRYCRKPKGSDIDAPLAEGFGLDALYSLSDVGLTAIEVGYGLDLDGMRDAVDRLLRLSWMTGSRAVNVRSVDLVAYMFVYECGFGEIIRNTERRIDTWIGDNYGPFAGLERIQLPMFPRLTRTAKASPRDGTVVSAIDLKSRPTGFAAFCISYLREQP